MVLKKMESRKETANKVKMFVVLQIKHLVFSLSIGLEVLLASKNFSVYLQFNTIITAEKGNVELKPVSFLPYTFCSLCHIILKCQSFSCNSAQTQGYRAVQQFHTLFCPLATALTFYSITKHV